MTSSTMTRPTPDEVFARTRMAMRRIDHGGRRGLSMVSNLEIEALAITVVTQSRLIAELIEKQADQTETETQGKPA